MLFQELSIRDRDFLFAMLADKTVSDFSSIKERLNVTAGYASKYRSRLLVAGMIKAAEHGKISFAPPYMREYLLRRGQ
jgi:predicted transcriptional regulator